MIQGQSDDICHDNRMEIFKIAVSC